MKLPGLAAPLALAMAAIACSSQGSLFDSQSAGPSDADYGDAGSAAPTVGGDGREPSLVPTDNGVIMVHAAGAPAFRLCFENELDRLPQPDSQAMPEANIVGVDVGTAVRIEPLRGAPGKVWMFEEPLIRSSYPQYGAGGAGPTCKELVDSKASTYAHELGPVSTDLSRGVHLLVVAGCSADTALTKHTKAECGDDFAAATGNLRLIEQELTGGLRNDPGELPSQVIHLSPPVESARAGSTLTVSFGDVTDPGSTHESVATGPVLFGEPLALSTPPRFDATDESVYANVGFRVSLDDGKSAPVVLVQQSLADVQRLSAPREIPTTYYAAASNYVLLLLGDPSPKTSDGGVDDDVLRNVHLLAVPVIEPKPDAGADGGAGDLDAGPTPGNGI